MMEQILPTLIVGVTVGALVAFITHAFARAIENERWNRDRAIENERWNREDSVQREQRRTELEGLLRLVSMEIVLHTSLVLDQCLPADLDKCRVLTTDAWEQARVRIAQLLPAERFTSLVEYYTSVQYFNLLF